MPTAPLTVAHALSAWRLDPLLLLAVAGAVAYGLGVRALRRRGQRWPVGRSAVFAAGVVILGYVTAGWLGVYARALFWVFTTQTLALLLAVPILIALGRPLALLDALRHRPSARSRLVRALDNPLLGPALVPLVTAAIFFTPLLDLALRHAAVDAAVRLLLLLAGAVLAVPLAGDGVLRRPVAIAAAIFVGFFELLADAIPGIVLRLAPAPVSSWFAGLDRGWGPSALADQHTAGSVLWVVAEVVDLPFLALMVLLWIRADAAEAAAVDATLDAAEAARGRNADRADTNPPGTEKPWWETDAAVFGSARAARFSPRRPG